MKHTPTPEQSEILDFVRGRCENLLITARAGAAKTTTLELLARGPLKAMPCLSLAFNKAIKEEMAKRLPSTVECSTLNSLGHRAWLRTLGGRLSLNSNKVAGLLRDWLTALSEESKTEADELRPQFGTIVRAVALGKHQGWVPSTSRYHDKSLIDDETFFASLEEDIVGPARAAVLAVSADSIEAALDRYIDFDDQILMPVLWESPFPQYPCVLVDEAQDLSPLNHAMLERLLRAPAARLIAVGDPYQAIYAFRGAHNNSMALLKERFSMEELKLTTTFRCGKEIVREAHSRAPDMVWPEWASDGAVLHQDQWSLSRIADGDAVICRNNAPLFRLAIDLLKAGRRPMVRGSDTLTRITSILKGLGTPTTSQEIALNALAEWHATQLRKTRSPDTIDDLADCLEFFIRQGADLRGAQRAVEHLTKTVGPIHLMTGHKSKGLEYNTVFFLDSHLIREDGQDPNIRYVIQTRAKEALIYINSKDRVA